MLCAAIAAPVGKAAFLQVFQSTPRVATAGRCGWRRFGVDSDAGRCFQSTPALPRGDATSPVAGRGPDCTFQSAPRWPRGDAVSRHANPQDWKNSFNPRPAGATRDDAQQYRLHGLQTPFPIAAICCTGRCRAPGRMNLGCATGAAIHARAVATGRCNGATDRWLIRIARSFRLSARVCHGSDAAGTIRRCGECGSARFNPLARCHGSDAGCAGC